MSSVSNPNRAGELPGGFIRDGVVDPGNLLKVNADGSINTVGGSSTTPSVVTEQGLPSLATGQVSVATTAGGTLIVAARATRSSVLVVNAGTVTIFVGPSGLTISTGLPIQPGGFASFPTTAAVYGIVATGTQTAAYAEVY